MDKNHKISVKAEIRDDNPAALEEDIINILNNARDFECVFNDPANYVVPFNLLLQTKSGPVELVITHHELTLIPQDEKYFIKEGIIDLRYFTDLALYLLKDIPLFEIEAK